MGLGSADAIFFSFCQIEVCYHLCLCHCHLVIHIFHYDTSAGSIRQCKMNHHGHRSMQVILSKKLHCFIHICRPVKKQPNCCCGRQIRFPCILVNCFRILNHVYRNSQPFLIHTVKGRIKSNCRLYTVRQSGDIYPSRLNKVHIHCGNRRISILRS